MLSFFTYKQGIILFICIFADNGSLSEAKREKLTKIEMNKINVCLCLFYYTSNIALFAVAKYPFAIDHICVPHSTAL